MAKTKKDKHRHQDAAVRAAADGAAADGTGAPGGAWAEGGGPEGARAGAGGSSRIWTPMA